MDKAGVTESTESRWVMTGVGSGVNSVAGWGAVRAVGMGTGDGGTGVGMVAIGVTSSSGGLVYVGFLMLLRRYELFVFPVESNNLLITKCLNNYLAKTIE